MKEQKLMLLLSQALIGTGFFFLYVQHVRSIFESRTEIAHKTQVERESLLRREDALYYSFYKTLVEEPNFWSGFEKLKNVTGIEYPHHVNVLQRFHVLPELVIGYLYHQLRHYAYHEYIPFFNCWRANDPRLPIEHRYCDGIGHPMEFYLECVWWLGGITVIIIYVYGILLSENVFGGIYAVVSYIMFHSFASKIYIHPMARENFAFPFIFAQIFYLCMCIDRVTYERACTSRLKITLRLTLLTTIALLCWQFASVIFATQVLIMMTPWSLSTVVDNVSRTFTIDYAFSQLIANVLAYYLSFGNKKFVFAWQIGPAIGLFFICILRRVKPQTQSNEFSLKTVSLGIVMAVSAQGTIIDLLEKSGLARSVDNAYALYRDLIIHWGLQAKVNFTTSLAACNPAYRRMDVAELWELIKILVVKPYCMYGVVMLAKFFRKWRKSSEKKTPSSDYIERAKKYILEDFLEENHISMREMSNKETERDLNECLKLLESCDYDYDRYKIEKSKKKKSKVDEHSEFMNDIRKLKEQIHELQEQKLKEQQEAERMSSRTSAPKNTNSEGKTEEEVIEDVEDETKPKPSKAPNAANQTEVNSNNSHRPARDTRRDLEYSEYENDIFNFHYLYSFIQMAVFTVMGLSIRKLFFLSFTQGCVIAPTICSKFWYRKQRNIFWSVSLAVFLTSIISPGLVNLREEYFPQRSNVARDGVDTMLEWINMNTEKDAVFAGPIDVIGTVYLATGRPIVNHAHLEMRQISDRTEHVYSVFSRQQSSDIYNQCSQLKIQYLIISLHECSNDINDECDLLSIWDDVQPAYRKYPQFCSELANKNIPSFLKVFSNEHYGIIKMFSQSVQINLKYSKMPEKVM